MAKAKVVPSSDEIADRLRRERDAFHEVVRQEEALALRDPDAYARRLRTLAYLGYAYIFSILAFCLALIIGLIAFMISAASANILELKLIIGLGIVLVVTVRSLWVKLDPPDGVPLSRDDFPELHKEIDRIRSKVNAPPIDQVFLLPELNAMAGQFPKFGFFGPTKNVLFLGLPLLLSLTPAEANSVIAHELGHFAGGHGAFSAWIYRLNTTWERIHTELVQKGASALLFSTFFNWFQPKFAATSFALRRQHEYAADAVAVSVSGADSAANALLRMTYLVSKYEREFWEPLQGFVAKSPAPPADYFEKIVAVSSNRTEDALIEERIALGLRSESDYEDVHPALPDRLKAMGWQNESAREIVARLSAAVEPSAAHVFLGQRFEETVAHVGAWLYAQMEPGWKANHDQLLPLVKELEELVRRSETESLSDTEEAERAFLTYQIEGAEAAVPLLSVAVERWPENARLSFLLGEVLLDIGDEQGISYLERAKVLEPKCSKSADRNIFAFRAGKGDTAALKALADDEIASVVEDRLFELQLGEFSLDDALSAETIPSEDRTGIQAALQKVGWVRRAYLVEKRFHAKPDLPILAVYAFPDTTKYLRYSHQGFVNEVIKALEDFQVIVYAPDPAKPWLKKLDAIPDALIFDARAPKN